MRSIKSCDFAFNAALQNQARKLPPLFQTIYNRLRLRRLSACLHVYGIETSRLTLSQAPFCGPIIEAFAWLGTNKILAAPIVSLGASPNI